MINWYLIQTKLNSENIAVKNLNNQGFQTYCPKVRIKNKISSLFPRYVFVSPKDEKQDIRPIRSTKGVANIVRFGLNTAKVSQKIIDTIKIRENITADKIIELSKFHKGEKIEILDGVFAGNIAIFSEYNGENRSILLLKIINSEQKIIFDNKQIKKF